eukprot:1802553-Rhodomonas_salina.2
MPGTDLCACTGQYERLSSSKCTHVWPRPKVLRACYAVSGTDGARGTTSSPPATAARTASSTDAGHAGTRSRRLQTGQVPAQVQSAMLLRVRYFLPGTDVAYAATSIRKSTRVSLRDVPARIFRGALETCACMGCWGAGMRVPKSARSSDLGYRTGLEVLTRRYRTGLG